MRDLGGGSTTQQWRRIWSADRLDDTPAWDIPPPLRCAAGGGGLFLVRRQQTLVFSRLKRPEGAARRSLYSGRTPFLIAPEQTCTAPAIMFGVFLPSCWLRVARFTSLSSLLPKQQRGMLLPITDGSSGIDLPAPTRAGRAATPPRPWLSARWRRCLCRLGSRCR